MMYEQLHVVERNTDRMLLAFRTKFLISAKYRKIR